MTFADFITQVNKLAKGSCESFANRSNISAFPHYTAKIRLNDSLVVELVVTSPSCTSASPSHTTGWQVRCRGFDYATTEPKPHPSKLIDLFFRKLTKKFYLFPHSLVEESCESLAAA